MSIEHATHSAFDPESNVIEIDGEIMPYDATLEPKDYVDDFSKRPHVSQLPPEVFAVVHEAAQKEDILRRKGATPKRIAKLAHIPLEQALIHLHLDKVDTSLALPPEVDVAEDQGSGFTVKEEAEFDRLVDNAGKSVHEAEEIIKARRKS